MIAPRLRASHDIGGSCDSLSKHKAHLFQLCFDRTVCSGYASIVLFGGVRGMKSVMDAETGMVQEVPLCGQEIHSFSI